MSTTKEHSCQDKIVMLAWLPEMQYDETEISSAIRCESDRRMCGLRTKRYTANQQQGRSNDARYRNIRGEDNAG
jgi:hypothetical protein